jgi:hypothetical protein
MPLVWSLLDHVADNTNCSNNQYYNHAYFKLSFERFFYFAFGHHNVWICV